MKGIAKFLFAILTFVFLSGGLFGCSNDNGALPKKVVVGTQTLVDPEAIVKAENWFEDAFGVDVDVVNFDAGRDVVNAMISGSIDFGLVGSVPAALAIANNVPCKMVYIQSVLGEFESLVVRSDLNVLGASDLIGLKIATTFSSTAHYSLLKYLEANDISANSVDIIDMKTSDIVAAYIRGDIDGAFTWEPNVTTLLNNNGTLVTSAREVAELGSATMDVTIVSNKFSEKYPDLVKAFTSCMERAVQLYKSEPSVAGEALARSVGLTAEECLNQVASSTWLTIDEQKDDNWFGSDALATILYDTAMFLYAQGDINDMPTLEQFTNAVTGQYLDSNTEVS